MTISSIRGTEKQILADNIRWNSELSVHSLEAYLEERHPAFEDDLMRLDCAVRQGDVYIGVFLAFKQVFHVGDHGFIGMFDFCFVRDLNGESSQIARRVDDRRANAFGHDATVFEAYDPWYTVVVIQEA